MTRYLPSKGGVEQVGAKTIWLNADAARQHLRLVRVMAENATQDAITGEPFSRAWHTHAAVFFRNSAAEIEAALDSIGAGVAYELGADGVPFEVAS